MARKTTTTTTTESRKGLDGNWEEYHRTVTTVVERDDDGYPYGPIQNAPYPYFAADWALKRYGQARTDWRHFYDAFGARPANTDDTEDTQNG